MLFLGSSKIVFDTQLDDFPLSKSVVLTTLTLKTHLFSYPLFLSLLACAATQSKLVGKERTILFFFFFFFFPISCENIGNESLFVGKNWNILGELSRDTVMGEHRTELRGVSGTVCEISQREGAAGQEKKKTCLGKAVVEKFMAYIGWLDQEHKRSQKIRNTKIIFFL